MHSSHDVGGPCECPEVIPSWAQIRRRRRVKGSDPEIFVDVFCLSRQYIGSERDSGRPALCRCGSTASIRTSLAWTAIGRCFAISRFRGNRARNLNWAKSPRNRGQITSAPEGGVGCTAPRTRPSAEGRNRAGGQALRSTRCGHQRCRRVFRALGIALLPNIREAVAALIDGPCRPKRGAKNDVTARNYLMSKGFILNGVRADADTLGQKLKLQESTAISMPKCNTLRGSIGL